VTWIFGFADSVAGCGATVGATAATAVLTDASTPVAMRLGRSVG